LVDIVLIRTSFVTLDPRVFKIVKSLSKKYSVLVLGWNREGITRDAIDKSILDVELFGLKAPFGRSSLLVYFYMLFYFTIFWTWILVKLIIHSPKVIHACDIDTVPPCLIYKFIFRKKLVFDATVRYAMAFIPTKSKTLYSIVNSFEELIGSQANVMVNGWKNELKTFRKRPKHCVTIMNCPEDYRTDGSKSETEVNDVILRIVYTGGIRSDRSLDKIAAAIEGLTNVELVMAGQVVDKKLFEKLIRIPNLKYKGFLDPRDALNLEVNSDIMVALYDLTVPWNNATSPNKFFEAMMCGIPIITNASAELIHEEDCGIIVGYDDAGEIRRAVVTLRDNKELRQRLGLNGRRAFMEKYNWPKMEDELFKLYGTMI